MANATYTTIPSSNWHKTGDLENDHKPMASYKWLGNAGVQVINSTLTPTHGNLNSDRPFEAKNTGYYNLWDTPQDMYAPQEAKGIRFIKNNTTAEMAFNLSVYSTGDNGMVIPAGLIRSVGVEGYRSTNANSNFRIWNIGLEFKYLLNDSTSNRLYTPGWTSGSDPSVGYDFKCFNGESHFNTIRSWGSDWGLYRVIFNLRSKGTSGAQTPRYRVYHVKVGHDAGLSSPQNYKIVKPANQAWSNYTTDVRMGMRKYK
jgi:hypothetical protein